MLGRPCRDRGVPASPPRCPLAGEEAHPRPDPDPAVEQTRCPATGRRAGCTFLHLFIELHQALTAECKRPRSCPRRPKRVAATRQLQQELAALRQENLQLRAKIEAGQAERGELETAKQAAEARAAELTRTVEQAKAQAREIDQQLPAVTRWQNAQSALPVLRHGARATWARTRAHADRARSEIEKLDGGASRRAPRQRACVSRWRPRNNALQAADSARAEVEAQLRAMRASLQRAEQEKASIGTDLAKVKASWRAPGSRPRCGARTSLEWPAGRGHGGRERRVARSALGGRHRAAPEERGANAQLETQVADLRDATGIRPPTSPPRI